MSTTAELSENSHQGFEGLKAGVCPASMEAKSNNASGLRGCLRREGIGSRCSGKERDETGLDYFGARYLSSALGRFTSPDPLLNSGRPDDPQSWNRYSYVSNNPLRFTDPTGLVQESSGCGGNEACEEQYRKHMKRVYDGIAYLKKAEGQSFGTKNDRIKKSRKALGEEGEGPVVKFDTIKGPGAAAVTKDGGTLIVDPAKFRAEDTDKWLSVDLGQEGTHLSDLEAIKGGADKLSDFSLEFRGYQTSAFVFEALFTPSSSASQITSFGGGPLRLTYDKVNIIWNVSWSAADEDKIKARDAAITNTLIGFGHQKTEMPDSWKNK